MKTSGVGKITSWATFSKAKGATPVTQDYVAPVYDRVAPIIVAARAIADNSSSGKAQLKLTFSESVQKNIITFISSIRLLSRPFITISKPSFSSNINL